MVATSRSSAPFSMAKACPSQTVSVRPGFTTCGIGRHQREGGIAAGAIQHRRHNARMDEQLGVLFFLQKSPGALLKDVSDALGVNASAITALIGRMEDAGLVRRKPSRDDQRAIHLFATASGLAKAAAARPVLARLNTRLTGDFSERDIATVARFLDAILEWL